MIRRPLRAVLGLLLAVITIGAGASLVAPPPARSQGADVLLNVLASGAKKLNVAIPDFAVATGQDPQQLAKGLAEIVAKDLRFSALFNVVAGSPAPPAGNPDALRKLWGEFAASGAHAGLYGLLGVRGQRLEVEMRLYDLTTPEMRLIASKRFEMLAAESRRLAHKVADEVVLQFTGQPGIADTKIAFVAAGTGNKELYLMDYDGVGLNRLTANQSINLSPVWSPDSRSLAFTSFMGGYPYVYRLYTFERRPVQLLAGFRGVNSSPAWSPDGRAVALTLSKDGNPEIYVLNMATGGFRRLTTHPGIDTDPSWSPTGREIAFVSERAGGAHIFVMDAEGANVRRISNGGFNTQPRWSPRGDTIVYTSRQGGLDLWAVNPDGSNRHPLTAGPGRNESASWAPNGRHLVFQSDRTGRFQLYTMLADGSEQQVLPRTGNESTSPSWSQRLP